ncbi:MAG: DUF6348 family protein [Deferribacteraceae bacterium]|jgi:hypothetical protein|nr:DUF6348 family protein [Deferribacteraceae bacterium]
MENVAKVLAALKAQTEGAEIKDDNLIVLSAGLLVHVEVAQAEESKDDQNAIAVVYFWLDHPSFEDALFETAAALGDNLDDALENASKSFFAGIYSTTLEYLAGESSDMPCLPNGQFSTVFAGEARQWDVVESDLVFMGEPPLDCKKGYLPMISEQLALHIGNKPLYYIKIYTCKQPNGKIICEVRINDVASTELSAMLQDYVHSWKTDSLHSQKQFYFLSQKNPQNPYPYSREEIEAMTIATAKLFGEYDINDLFADEDEDESEAQIELEDKILHIAKNDKCLAAELRIFLPEMLSIYHFDAPQLESFSINGETVYADQITPWHWMYAKLIDGFQSKELAGQSYSNLINMSSTCGAFAQMKDDGSDISQARFAISMGMPDNYKIR